MEDKTLKKRLTISLDYALLAKLDKRNRSGDVERILKQHFQNEGFEMLYNKLKQRLLQDPDFTTNTNQTQPVARTYTPCCNGYPNDLDCGHWYRLDENYLKNKRNGETREY